MTEKTLVRIINLMQNKWKKLGEKVLFKGKYQTLFQKDFQLPNGRIHSFEVSQGYQASIVLAFTQEGQVIVEKQFRTGPERIFYELPAGMVDPGEAPEETALRELGEETCYTGNLEFVAEVYPAAYAATVEYVFVAKNCYKSRDLSFDDGEYLETIIMPLQEFRQILKSGLVLNTHAAYLGLDHLGMLS